MLLATTPASARVARLASGPSRTYVHDAHNRTTAKSASPTRKSYVGGRTRVGPWLSGKEEDIEVGLTYFGARYYAPYLGRWASADPLTIHALGSDLNPYAYVGGRVMSHVDPFGLEPAPKGSWSTGVHAGEWMVQTGPNDYSIGNIFTQSPASAQSAEAKAERAIRKIVNTITPGGALQAIVERGIEVATTAADPNAHVSGAASRPVWAKPPSTLSSKARTIQSHVLRWRQDRRVSRRQAQNSKRAET